MAYELIGSFTPDFFGDVYTDTREPGQRPYNIADALRDMPDETWDQMAEEIFDISGEMLDLDMVMDKIRETNTVGSIESPVDVWIDEEGYYTVEVYDPVEEEAYGFVDNPEEKSKKRVVCAWCKKVVKEGPKERTSHTICEDCYIEKYGEEEEDDDEPPRKRNFYDFKGTPRDSIEEWLSGTIIVTGKVEIDTESEDPVTLAIVHDGTGFQPAASIRMEQGQSKDATLQIAFNNLEVWMQSEHPDYLAERHVPEEEEETAHWDGRVWQLRVNDAVKIVEQNKDDVLKYVEIDIF